MSTQSTETSEVDQKVVDLVPLALIAVEVGESVEWTARQFAGHVQLNEIGMRCAPSDEVKWFFAKRYEDRKRRKAEHARRTAELAARGKPRVVAAPALEGRTPYESMAAAAGGIVTPEAEFGGREKPTFLEDALAEGNRRQAQFRAEAAEKKRAAEKLRKSLQ